MIGQSLVQLRAVTTPVNSGMHYLPSRRLDVKDYYPILPATSTSPLLRAAKNGLRATRCFIARAINPTSRFAADDRAHPSGAMNTTTLDKSSNSQRFTVVGVLGGPGSGKGTQCKLLAQDYKLAHISIGDVLREEMKRKDSKYAAIIEQNMRAGTISPKEITIGILGAHIQAAVREGTDLFVLDGFPRNLEQAQYFEEVIGPVELVIVLECPDDILINRLLPRMRFDDNLESINKRLRTFHETTSQVINWFSEQREVVTLNAETSIEAINKRLVEILANKEEESRRNIKLVKRPKDNVGKVLDQGHRRD
ncbi:hypothetical protein O1611_g365 [Lasiodiplodia mahajangana]|uniref:Uncharacterized protein n=1 Tax=Lasiodiplodia mahajangana TaxID=1108764 RepID=A0ACC2K0S5_9PEZI|nr:hypothetical protein O1611_g365 [Lasiodiplodia mahajangana]